MKTRTAFALSFMAALCASPLQSSAQQQRGAGPGGPVSPVQHLLSHADALGLSDDQRAALEDIQEQLREASGPTGEKLRKLRDSGDRDAMRSQGRPLMEELRGFEEDALSSALASMEGEQREAAETLVAAFQEERRQRRGRRRPQGQR